MYNQYIQDIVEFLRTLYTLGQIKIMLAAGIIGGTITYLLGGIDKSIITLLTLVIIDYLSGLSAAAHRSEINSAKGFKGITKKLLIFLTVAVSNLLDCGLDMGHTLRTMTILAYTANEGVSILENIERMGYGNLIPEALRNKLTQLQQNKVGGSGKC